MIPVLTLALKINARTAKDLGRGRNKTSNLGVGGSNPSERAKKSIVQPGHIGDRSYLRRG
jgi:hypothetical protein